MLKNIANYYSVDGALEYVELAIRIKTLSLGVVIPDIVFSFGINNLFDKRLYRMGNAIGVNRPRTIYGAGAATYNEPGRSFYVGLSARF